MGETETFVKTLCGECWLRVSAWRDDDRTGHAWDFVQIDQVSSHQHAEGILAWHNGLRNRLRLIWAVLRGRGNPATAWHVFDAEQEFREYIGTLQQAADTVWPAWENAPSSVTSPCERCGEPEASVRHHSTTFAIARAVRAHAFQPSVTPTEKAGE